MSGLHPELAFWLVLLGLYLSDLATLVNFNEALVRTAGAGYSVRLSPKAPEIGSRLLLVLNPFTPGRLEYRVPWGAAQCVPASPDPAQVIRHGAGALRTPKRLCSAIGIVLFGALPAGSIALGFEAAFAPGVILAYVLLAAATWLIVRRLDRLRVPRGKAVMLIIVAWLCLPYAINLCRRLSLLVDIRRDASVVLPALLGDAGWTRFAEATRQRATEEIERGLTEDTEASLKAYIARELS